MIITKVTDLSVSEKLTYNCRMHILFVSRKFPPSVGGMEQFAYDLSTSLAAKTEVTAVTWGGQGRLKAVLVALPYLFVRSFLVIFRQDIDIIHVNDGVMAPIGYLLSKLFDKPFVVVIHGLDITYTNPLFKAVVPWAVRRAEAVFCISQAAAEQVSRHGIASERIVTVPLAVQDTIHKKSNRDEALRRMDLPEDSKLLLTVGRLVERKGVAWFITSVLPGLAEQYPELIYLVVGEGEGRPAVEAAIQNTQMDKHVHLLGRVEDDLYEAAYNGANIFVMPNIEVPGDIEGFGLVVLEASLCELPVVAAGIEGIKDAVIDGQNGMLVPSGDAIAFQQRIGELLADPAAARKFGKKSRQYTLKHYQWDAIAERYIGVYKQTLQ
jgi:glycosyltransferase involved in cell wall biosynthesis